MREALPEQEPVESGEPMHVLDHDSLTVERPIEDADAGDRTWLVHLDAARRRGPPSLPRLAAKTTPSSHTVLLLSANQ
jgi:hypothetical protein